MDYIELRGEVSAPFIEILIAELAEIGYDMFEETANGFLTYIDEDRFNDALVNSLFEKYNPAAAAAFSWRKEKKQNWNALWESNYEPIEVDDRVRVRADFHKPSVNFAHELVINPKMSFGTGHHDTTWLMMKAQLDLPHRGISLMDVGCGTGILGILGKKLGAARVLAFDIEEWAAANTLENFEMNDAQENSEIFQGTIHEVRPGTKFDGVLANINRNVLMEEIPLYANKLAAKGWLAVSGFYLDDRSEIVHKANSCGLELSAENSRNNWLVMVFNKPED